MASVPLVSVIMPVHNADPYLSLAVESVLGQSYRELELIVVDDCSSDGAADFLAAHDDPRVVYVRNATKLGAAKSRNVAIERAKADFVAIQDADDVSCRDRLAISMDLFRREPDTSVVFGDHRYIDAKGNHLGDVVLPTSPLAAAIGFRTSQPFGHGSVTARRRCLIEAGGYVTEFEPAEDYSLFAECLLLGCVFRGTGRFHYDYRVHTEGISSVRAASLREKRRQISRRMCAVPLPGDVSTWTEMIAAERAGPRAQPRLEAAKRLLKQSRKSESLHLSTAVRAIVAAAGPQCTVLLMADALRASRRRTRRNDSNDESI